MKSFFIKISIVLIWIGIILGALVIPKIEFPGEADQRSIDVFVWGDYFDPKMISRFEKEHQIKVILHYYSSNEEMMLKLRAHKGKGYDLVVPSDYAVQILIKENLLQPIDYSKVDFMHKITPILLNHPFDPGNRFSIPNLWEIYGIGSDPEQIDQSTIKPTLGHFFDPRLINYKFSMTPDPIEAVVFASCYLYGHVTELNKAQAQKVKSLLISQKPYVEAYADYRAKYLMQTKNCPIAILRSSLLFQIAREQANMGFIIPEETTITSMENVAIPIGCKKQDLVYTFLNFIYQDDVHASQLAICPLFPAIKECLPYSNEAPIFYEVYEEALNKKNHYFFRHLIPEEELRDMWVEIKN